MKTNITLKLDKDLLRRAKIVAAERDTSVSALLAEQLEKAVRERDGYEQAKRRALGILKKGFDLGYKPPASRDELHDR
jgi:predicted transcriptional regulator